MVDKASLEAKITALEGQIADVHAQEEEIRAKLKSVRTISFPLFVPQPPLYSSLVHSMS